MFVHDFVVVERPYRVAAGDITPILQLDLARFVANAWRSCSDVAPGREVVPPPTVLIGPNRQRIDAIVYPVAWPRQESCHLPGVEFDIELSELDDRRCDRHALGSYDVTPFGLLTPAQTRRIHRATVVALRSVLEMIRGALEMPLGNQADSRAAAHA